MRNGIKPSEKEAYRVPELPETCRDGDMRAENRERKTKKDDCATGNPVKAGYIIMICPGFLPKNIPFRRFGGVFVLQKM